MSWTLGIFIFDDVEVLDFCGPFEVFSVTRLDAAKRMETSSPFDVRLIAATADPISTRGGMRVTPDHSIADCPDLDILLVPGGVGTRPLIDDEPTIDWLRTVGGEVELLTSVCTGSLLLAAAGHLTGRPATTHWMALDLMAERFPDVTVVRDRHFVIDGAIATSAGISAGIDLSLRLVSQLCGEAAGRETARYMEYPYPESDHRRIES
ncbi:MAG: DJ-1/PfpI family protein [Pseudomonadota bacterium]